MTISYNHRDAPFNREPEYNVTVVAGNIFAVYDFTFEGSIANASPVRCRQDLGGYADSWTLNDSAMHACASSTTVPSYEVRNNEWLASRPCSALPATYADGSFPRTACLNGITGKGASFKTNVTEHVLSGSATPVDDGRVACGGVRLPLELITNGQAFGAQDMGGFQRLQNRPGVDDDCDNVVDEPGEVSNRNSVGAFDRTCFCSARHMVIQ